MGREHDPARCRVTGAVLQAQCVRSTTLKIKTLRYALRASLTNPRRWSGSALAVLAAATIAKWLPAEIYKWTPAVVRTLGDEKWELGLDITIAVSLIAVAVHLNFERAWCAFTTNPKKAIMAIGKKILALTGMPTPVINLLAKGVIALTNLFSAVKQRVREIREEEAKQEGIAIGRAQVREELGLPPETGKPKHPKKLDE